jgi:hypothetical protein
MPSFRSRQIAVLVLFLFAAVFLCQAQKTSDKSLTMVFKDGHQKTFALPSLSRIEFKNNAMLVIHDRQQESIPVADIVSIDFNSPGTKSPLLGRNYFVGKWELGEGAGMSTFTITLKADGQAQKDIGAPHGTWAVVDGEARISWDDGWRDVIRKVGDKNQKFAYEPGRSLSDQPSNVANAKRLDRETM